MTLTYQTCFFTSCSWEFVQTCRTWRSKSSSWEFVQSWRCLRQKWRFSFLSLVPACYMPHAPCTTHQQQQQQQKALRCKGVRHYERNRFPFNRKLGCFGSTQSMFWSKNDPALISKRNIRTLKVLSRSMVVMEQTWLRKIWKWPIVANCSKHSSQCENVS